MQVSLSEADRDALTALRDAILMAAQMTSVSGRVDSPVIGLVNGEELYLASWSGGDLPPDSITFHLRGRGPIDEAFTYRRVEEDPTP